MPSLRWKPTSYGPVFGTRPLKRFLQRELETRIGRAIVGGEVSGGAVIKVDVKKGEIVIQVKEQAVSKEDVQPSEA